MTTQSNWTIGLALTASLLIGCGSGPTGPERGSAEWYWQSAMTAYEEGRFPAALEELEYAAEGEGEFATRATVLTGVLTAGLARANLQVSDILRASLEENAGLRDLVGTSLQQVERDARQNIISFVEGMGDFKTALGDGDVTLSFPFPPGNRNVPSTMNVLQEGERISAVQLTDGVSALIQRGIAESFSMVAGMEDNMTAAQEKLDAGPVTVPAEQFKLIIAGFLVEMSESFTQKKMNQPKIREVVIQRAEEWIATGLESDDAELKEHAEELKFVLENERRDMKGEGRLMRN